LCSFQLDHNHLHLVAHYRSQYLVQRGYGNYLGLGRLLGYVAEATGLLAGELMVVAGYIAVDGYRRAVTKTLASTADVV
jgi:thymidylate synthase